MKRILEGLQDLNIVGADVVEVSLDYDTNAKITSIAAADLMIDVISMMAKKGPLGGFVNDEKKETGKDEL